MDEKRWINKGEYWLTLDGQSTDFWREARFCRVSGSNIGALVGHSYYSDKVRISREITGVLQRVRGYDAQINMQRGNMYEADVRKWYSSLINKNIEEVGLAVPKWDLRFGVSVDGIIDSDNICEFKIPNKMYKPLIIRRNEISQGKIFDKYDYSHIFDTHYDQMQLGMAILGANNCHYVVYVLGGDVYTEVIPFNQEYWKNLYSIASKEYDELISPLMEEYNLKRIDPQ